MRSLVFYNYDDNPESFVCPVSPDQFKPLEPEAKTDIRNFYWSTGSGPQASLTTSPLYARAALAGDRNASAR